MIGNRDDSQYITRITERDREVHRLRTRRQKIGHATYGAIAAGTGSLTLLAWGTILRDAAFAGPAPLTRSYLASLAAALVLGVSAAAATATWMTVRVAQRLHADADQIKEYDNDRMVKNVARQIISTASDQKFVKTVADEVTRRLDERERAARQQRWETFLTADTGTAGPAPQQQPQRASDPVIPFTRRPGSARNSG